jgi:hypothetical protein
LQPRVRRQPDQRGSDALRVFSGDPELIRTRAVSDVYRNLFQAVHRQGHLRRGRSSAPWAEDFLNRILSRLLESSCWSLVTDVILFEEFPARYPRTFSAARWMRATSTGFAARAGRGHSARGQSISVLSRWKILTICAAVWFRRQ